MAAQAPEPLFTLLLASTLGLAALLALLVLVTSVLQWRRDHASAHRIQLHQAWEHDLPGYLFQQPRQLGVFARLAAEDRTLARTFLGRFRSAVGSEEALALRDLYHALDLDQDLLARLQTGTPQEKALAATEVWAFSLHAHLPHLLPLLEDPHPFVALAAARTLARSQDLRFADPVLDWVERQETYQQDRLLALLKSFGPDLVPWLNERTRSAGGHPLDARLFALMASVHRSEAFLPELQALVAHTNEDVAVAALKAVDAIGHPASFLAVAARMVDPSPVVRIHATRALGALGGPMATAFLVEALGDRTFDVRRTAAQSLATLGTPGASALSWVASDPGADPFARDMAQAQLEWLQQRGRG